MNSPASIPVPIRAEIPFWKRGWVQLGVLLAGPVLWLFEPETRLMWEPFWEELCQWGQFHLRLVHEDSPVLWMLWPTILAAAIAGWLRLSFDRPPDWLRLPLALTFLALQAGYLGFRLVATLSLDTWADGIVSVLFFVSEAFIHFRIALGNFSLLRLTDRSPQADASQRLVQAGGYAPAVDVFVPTYSEPVEMLRRTIIGCQAMDYPRKTIYLLDDQRRPAMRKLAQELGCRYLDRPDNQHAKAGNLNHALPLSDGELILCFDADFVPTKDFLQRTVGFFQDARVAMVQTPQNFFNEDAVTRNLGLERALEDEQRLFFRTLQPARDSVNAIVCHGSCFIVRRSALEAIGGVPTETITEDWATSIKLQAAGYKLLYLNEALSAGMSADRCGEFVQQRSRWAQGTLQALFASTNPLTVPGLNWKQRAMHFSSFVYYLGSVCNLFNLIAPLLFLFFGLHLLQMSIAEMIFLRLPFAIWFYMLYSWLTRGTRSAIWTEFYEVFLAPSMGLTAIRSLIKPFGVGFRVTDKTIQRQALRMNRRVAWPFALLFALHLAGLAFAVATNRHFEEREAFAIVTYFAAANIAMLWLCLLASFDVAQPHPHVRFAHGLPCALRCGDEEASGTTIELSEGDVVLALSKETAWGNFPRTATLDLPSLGLRELAVRFNDRVPGGKLTVEFVELTLPQRRALIEWLFCQPGQWDRPSRSESRAFLEYLRAGYRIYPLAEST